MNYHLELYCWYRWPAPFWKFWMPQSGFFGGLILGTTVAMLADFISRFFA